MRAAVMQEPGKPTVTTVADPAPGPDEVVIAVESCGVCGTDLHIYDGDFAPTPYPIVPGHEFAGEVVAVGAGVDGLRGGTFAAIDPSLFCGACMQCRRGRGNLCESWGAVGVTTAGAFAEFVRVPSANVYPLPDGVPRRWGALVEPVSCCVHALDRLPLHAGDTVLLYGAGTMGLLLGQLLRRADVAALNVVDVNPDRLPLARQLCADAAATAADEFGRAGWDVVIDATGAVPAIRDGLPRVRRGGTFLVFGVAPEDATTPFSPFTVYNSEISIIGSMAVLHSYGRAVDLVAAGAIDGDALLSDPLPLENFPRALDQVRAGVGLKTTISPVTG
jgi:2-desacetyl-2-hydroxyethyl bacteriochlorophyllide A dehydrogenase